MRPRYQKSHRYQKSQGGLRNAGRGSTPEKKKSIEIIKACNGSGMSKRQWCREHGISYSTFMRWQRSLRNELAGEIMIVPLQIEPQASRCTPAQEVTIQKDGISISMHGVSSDMVIAIVRGLSSCYAAAKAGVIGLTKTWAKEFARKGAAVRVNCIAPGYTMTDMPKTVPPGSVRQICGYDHAQAVGQTGGDRLRRAVPCQ